jgi:hypothetical protein
VHNISDRTVRNVHVSKQHSGSMPVRPELMVFDDTKTKGRDIRPGEAALVPIARWWHPVRQPGLLAGESALEYGPIVVTVTADDVAAARRTFRFDYDRVPMIFD